MNDFTYYACDHIGISGTTPVVIKKAANGYIARVGVALMGYTNMEDDEMAKVDYNPFHPDFYDNYAEGVGTTEEQAIDNLKKDMRSIADSLFD